MNNKEFASILHNDAINDDSLNRTEVNQDNPLVTSADIEYFATEADRIISPVEQMLDSIRRLRRLFE